MALEVIGSGLGRTGTKSLQTALNMLGFGPCYHMTDVFQDLEHKAPQWVEAGRGRPDWEAIFQGYRSTVDYPGAAYWRELTAYYPEAKVIHTIRDPEAWVESTQETIFRPGGTALSAFKQSGMMGDFFLSFTRDLTGHLHDREWLANYFQSHTREVKAAIPPDRLLVYQVSQGWGPLCDFLGVPEPHEPYPLQNTRADFIQRRSSLPPQNS